MIAHQCRCAMAGVVVQRRSYMNDPRDAWYVPEDLCTTMTRAPSWGVSLNVPISITDHADYHKSRSHHDATVANFAGVPLRPVLAGDTEYSWT